MSKWISAWGNATSISERREGNYAKNLTLRYSLRCMLDGSKIRIRFSNICGSEPVRITRAYTAVYAGETKILANSSVPITFNSSESGTIPAGGELLSDETDFECIRGTNIAISMYFEDMTQLMSSVCVSGPLSEFYFAEGDFSAATELPMDLRMPSPSCYFLNTVDILADNNAQSIILYGDSITAQSWPDRLNLKLLEAGINTAAIRRGVSGSRVLGQYDCVQYAHYGLSGKNRFVRECNCTGADSVLIFHGINDIIHPDGINPYRPMSNFPTLEEMMEGLRYYINEARKMGLRVYMATLLPIEGWRTYELWREELRCKINDWIRTTDEIDGVVDFDKVLRDANNPSALRAEFDSGDHLHPSNDGAQALAEKAFEVLFSDKK